MRRARNSAAQHAPDAGFALLEVLAAVAIAGLILSAIGSVVAVTMAGVRSAAERVSLTETARTLLDTLPPDRALQIGATTGMTGTMRWRIDVAPLDNIVHPPRQPDDDPASPNWQLARVAITARSPAGRTIRVDTVRLARWVAP